MTWFFTSPFIISCICEQRDQMFTPIEIIFFIKINMLVFLNGSTISQSRSSRSLIQTIGFHPFHEIF